MGSYTFVEEGELKIVDVEGLKEFLEKIRKEEEGYIHFQDFLESLEDVTFHPYPLDWDNNILNFKAFDEQKIIDYWYDEFVDFLRCLALFVRGTVELRYETPDKMAELYFDDGDLLIRTGEMVWTDNKPEESIDSDMPEWIKKKKTTNKI